MMSGVNDIDFTGLEGLVHLSCGLKLHGVLLHLSELKGPVSDRLQVACVAQWLTGQIFRTQDEAMKVLGSDTGRVNIQPRPRQI